MKLDPVEACSRFETARVARLATVSDDGRPHLVPVTFAVVDDVIAIAVDHKPKSTVRLRRLANIAANPQVSLLVDEYDDDWDRLWWVRADVPRSGKRGRSGPERWSGSSPVTDSIGGAADRRGDPGPHHRLDGLVVRLGFRGCRPLRVMVSRGCRRCMTR
ncbi:TIGR03668 family PPOX class F420-dependent oxidoreductase [Streptosporangium jomthongense]|uniref:TIGR03668 family PPOX class F420-dependent oxidoreductase n=1 Tax=Streptosporangium jomthongense TaxID=1193683 RepID=A0ABV8F6W5_9ACTN